MVNKIPCHIVSGFLGSGKTTFLKRIIEKFSEETKIGIVQNEFGPANIDGHELSKTGKNFELLEIKNGSVFCVCLMNDFVRLLGEFIDEHHPEVLIIEASGLSDTTSVSEVISSGTLANRIYLASNWCIVDAMNYFKTGLHKQRVMHQIRMADVVVINKTDLGWKDSAQIRDEIKEINPFAEIIETTFCKIDFELGRITGDKFYMNSEKAMSRPEINSMVIKSNRKLSLKSLTEFLNEWAPRAYRIKGFVNLNNGMTAAIQCTFGSVGISETTRNFLPAEIIALTEQFSLKEWNKSFKALK